MGQVSEVEHTLRHRRSAMKLILPESASNRVALSRFEREVQAMASLSHWNTVRIFDYGGSVLGSFYYVMELLDGLTLEELVDRNGPLTPERTTHLPGQTRAALEEAHRTGLVHRDLKSPNLMTTSVAGIQDVIKVVDFGLVRVNDPVLFRHRRTTHQSAGESMRWF